MSHPSFSGVITAIVSPFQASGEIDQQAFIKLLKMQKAAGISGVVVAGTTGEGPTLTEAEKDLLVSLALQERTDDFHVYVGTGTNNTRETIELSSKYGNFQGQGGKKVDGVMVVSPYYNKPPQSSLVAHFSAVAKAVKNVPICVYNVPGRTVVNISPETFGEVAKQNENIVAIKEAAGDELAMVELKKVLTRLKLGRDIQILSGDDPSFAPALLCGATGVISVTSHLIPGAMIGMLEAVKKNDFRELQRLQLATYPVNKGLFCVANPIGLKWALEHLDVCQGHLRLPLTPIEAKDKEIVRKALEEVQAAGIKLLT